MSLNRISFLEGWERNPAAFLRGSREEPLSDTDSDTYQDLPDTSSLSSSFPSTYSRLNFNPYAGPGWNEVTDDHDRPSLLGSLGLVLSPTTTQSRGDPLRPASPASPAVSGAAELGLPKEPASWSDTTGAFEVSPAKRVAQICLAVVYCFLAAGVVFGFAALKPVLIRENVYRNFCSKQELEDGVAVCDGQEIRYGFFSSLPFFSKNRRRPISVNIIADAFHNRLNLMFTIAAVGTNVSALPVGTILDTYGPRIAGIIGSFCLAAGATLFALADKLSFDGYIPGYLLLALGGPFVFISSFNLSNAFPKHSGLILSMLTGAFDASSSLFLFFRLLSEHTAGSVSLQRFFLAYLVVPVFVLAAQITIMPSTSYKTAGELVLQAETQVIEEIHDQVDDTIHDRNESERQRNDRRMLRQSIVHSIQGLLDDGTSSIAESIDDRVFNNSNGYRDAVNDPTRSNGNTNTNTNIDTNTPQSQPTIPNANTPDVSKSGIWGILHGQSALSQLKTPWFILLSLFTVLIMLRINYFITTIHKQYSNLLSSPTEATKLNTAFDILLPAGGLLSIPFIGTMLDNLRTRTVLFILVTIATLIGILGCIRGSTVAAYSNIALFVLYRPFYYTSVSDYAAKVFGFRTFGKVYGLVIFLAGVGNFAQAVLDWVTLVWFSGDPVPVNVGLTVAVAVVGGSFVGFVSWETEKVLHGEPASEGENQILRGGGNDVHPDILSRDWEREPLLGSVEAGQRQGERLYGS
ncbi:hypothetical protein N7478_008927 [Penicillium angulare]|uniref:uncharacterized protein n=1 Tax=Penicillium angulare TaxID=116970 RepID=UPI00253F8E50|nr:uncharacterized protein N7478_008927 [Penicillium angulare]KAJ5273802.1 hypothetical protein N7478_008927 [Penicillium angulare]